MIGSVIGQVGAMNLSKMPIFAALHRKMEWLSERQRVLSQNIANSDTPNYQPRDLKQMSFRELVGKTSSSPQLNVATTNNAHMSKQSSSAKGEFSESKQTKTYESAPAGNSVILEEQMLKLAETQLEYTTAANLYRKQVGLLKTAIGHKAG